MWVCSGGGGGGGGGGAAQQKAGHKQTDPPTIPMHELYTEDNYPIGQHQDYTNGIDE